MLYDTILLYFYLSRKYTLLQHFVRLLPPGKASYILQLSFQSHPASTHIPMEMKQAALEYHAVPETWKNFY